MNKSHKKWTLKDSDFAFNQHSAGVSNQTIGDELGRTAIAVGVHISTRKRVMRHSSNEPSVKPVPFSVQPEPAHAPTLFLVSFAGSFTGVALAALVVGIIQ